MNTVGYSKCTRVVPNANSSSRQFSGVLRTFDKSLDEWYGWSCENLLVVSYVKIASMALFMTWRNKSAGFVFSSRSKERQLTGKLQNYKQINKRRLHWYRFHFYDQVHFFLFDGSMDLHQTRIVTNKIVRLVK